MLLLVLKIAVLKGFIEHDCRQHSLAIFYWFYAIVMSQQKTDLA